MLGLTLRDVFQGRRLKGTAIELAWFATRGSTSETRTAALRAQTILRARQSRQAPAQRKQQVFFFADPDESPP